MEEINASKYLDLATSYVFEYGPKVIGAVLVWIIGSWIIKAISKGFKHVLNKQNIDDSLKPFLISIVGALLKVMLVLSVLGTLGIEMTSFIAILGAAGLAVGMALSGTLQNFAGGVIILIMKPFKVGHFIEAQGYLGTVKEIQIFTTMLKTPDNKTIILPNGPLSTSSLINYSAEELRRVDWTFGIAYGDSVQKAREVISNLCNADSRVLKDPELFIGVAELADSSINFAVRAWVKSDDYWDVFFEMNEKVYNEFPKQGLNIPFPQMDLHVTNNG